MTVGPVDFPSRRRPILLRVLLAGRCPHPFPALHNFAADNGKSHYFQAATANPRPIQKASLIRRRMLKAAPSVIPR